MFLTLPACPGAFINGTIWALYYRDHMGHLCPMWAYLCYTCAVWALYYRDHMGHLCPAWTLFVLHMCHMGPILQGPYGTLVSYVGPICVTRVTIWALYESHRASIQEYGLHMAMLAETIFH